LSYLCMLTTLLQTAYVNQLNLANNLLKSD
jgi:hypothetical protein